MSRRIVKRVQVEAGTVVGNPELHPYTVVMLHCGQPYVGWFWAQDEGDAQAMGIAEAPSEDHETVAIFQGFHYDLAG